MHDEAIPAAIFAALLDATKKLFALPLEEKMKIYIGLSRNHRGYVPKGEEVFAAGTKDRKEAFDLSLDLPPDDPDFLRGNPLLGPNQWPNIDGFSTQVMTYYHAVFSVGRAVMRGFAMALGEAPDFFDSYLKKPPSLEVGNKEIDEEHRRLIEILRDIARGIEKPDLNLCRAGVQAFIEASKDHFGKEEALLRRIGFPEVNEHKIYHASLLNHATELMRVCNEGASPPYVKACYDKVIGFLIDDVIRGDSQIKAYLSNLRRNSTT